MEYRFTINIGFLDGHEEIMEIPLDEYDPGKDDEAVLNSIWGDWAANYIDGGAYPVEEDEG